MTHRDRSWFKGLKYAEEIFKAYDNWRYGLFALEDEVDHNMPLNSAYNKGIRDYYEHLKNNLELIIR